MGAVEREREKTVLPKFLWRIVGHQSVFREIDPQTPPGWHRRITKGRISFESEDGLIVGFVDSVTPQGRAYHARVRRRRGRPTNRDFVRILGDFLCWFERRSGPLKLVLAREPGAYVADLYVPLDSKVENPIPEGLVLADVDMADQATSLLLIAASTVASPQGAAVVQASAVLLAARAMGTRAPKELLPLMSRLLELVNVPRLEVPTKEWAAAAAAGRASVREPGPDALVLSAADAIRASIEHALWTAAGDLRHAPYAAHYAVEALAWQTTITRDRDRALEAADIALGKEVRALFFRDGRNLVHIELVARAVLESAFLRREARRRQAGAGSTEPCMTV
jgi:hypothetical protein